MVAVEADGMLTGITFVTGRVMGSDIGAALVPPIGRTWVAPAGVTVTAGFAPAPEWAAKFGGNPADKGVVLTVVFGSAAKILLTLPPSVVK